MKQKREKLIEARKRKGLSQDAVAGLLGVTRRTYCQWELGNAEPYAYNIGQICDFFGVKDLSELDLAPSEPALVDIELPTTEKLWADDLLTIYEKGISACRDLFFNSSVRPVEAILPLYINQTTLLVREASALRQPAAILASHALRLASELATDREDFGTAEQAGKEAFFYARLAEDANLQVAALIILANLAFHRRLSTAALAAYQQAVSLLSEQVTPLLQGRTYAGLAEIHAMRGELNESMRAMGKAYEVYPLKPEEDPAYPYVRASRYALYVFGDAQSRLFLGQPKEADKALVAMRQETKDPEFEPITRLDMLFYESDIQVQSGDLESSQSVLTEAALLAKQLGSKLYFNKLAVTYHDLRLKLPREPRVLEMEDVFQPW
jgi:transcriptional regulator with XRE-family HTH domain